LARRRTFEGVIPIAKGHRYNRQAFTSAPGQNAKSSLRADVFRFAPNARSRCAPARCAGARAERPVAGREDSDGEVARSTRSAHVLSACNA
jgi:hypothetical protein